MSSLVHGVHWFMSSLVHEFMINTSKFYNRPILDLLKTRQWKWRILLFTLIAYGI